MTNTILELTPAQKNLLGHILRYSWINTDDNKSRVLIDRILEKLGEAND